MMNRSIAKAGALIVAISVFLFAVCMLIPFDFGSYFVCMLLAIGYVMMAAGFSCESDAEHRVAATAGMAFAVIYATLILLVYFAQTTTVQLDTLTDQAVRLLDYSRGGLMFSYDLLGYGMMALSTFFLGLTIRGCSPVDQWLKRLMIIHGIFFFGCFIMPMTGVFRSMAGGETSLSGVIALECWCAYFLPVGILAFAHFRSERLQEVFTPTHGAPPERESVRNRLGSLGRQQKP